MRLTQGTFSFLPDLTDDQIAAQVQYCVDNGWSVGIEHTDDPHPRNTYWEMWGPPMFDIIGIAPVVESLASCRAANPRDYIRISAMDSTKGWESVRASFIVQRPDDEPGFLLERAGGAGREVRYTLRSYAAVHPTGERYR